MATRTVTHTDGAAAIALLARDRGTTMTTTPLRRCIGSARFGIEAHEAASSEFPVQPSRPDGLGLMCRPHWRAYVGGLREARRAMLAASATAPQAGEGMVD